MSATDVASLAIRVESLQVAEADKRLDRLTQSGGRAEKATDGLTSSFKRLVGPLTAAVTAAGALHKLVDTQRQFDVLNASLITATGSTENAAAAFEALQQFAAKTPYDLAQVTESFTKLVNLGLTPSERALTSYGNTAAAMGKDMNQLIEAVADAATGEFERLKEFGIKARQNGDQVSLTFRGVTSTIGNSAAEIEKYLMALGENEFAGAMDQRMNSLDGAISNLGDSWDQLFLTISKAGIGESITDAVHMATDALSELTAMVASGELGAYLESITGQFENFGTDIKTTITILSAFIKDNFGQWSDDGQSAVSFILDAFKNLPSNVRALVQIITVELSASVDSWLALGTLAKDGLAAVFNDDTVAAAMERFHTRLSNIASARQSSIEDIMGERDAAVKASDAQIAAAQRLRAEYDKNQEAKKKASEGKDRLAQFKVGGDKSSSGLSKAAAAAEKARQKEFQSLVESLRTEEEAIAASYDKRKAIIEKGTKPGSAQRTDLMARLDKDHAEQLKKLAETKAQELDGLKSALRTEEEAIQESYTKRMDIISRNTEAGSALRASLEGKTAADRDKALAELEARKQQERDSLYNGLLSEQEMLQRAYEQKRLLILDSEAVTETERQDLLRRLKKQFDDEQAQAEVQRIQTQLGNASSLFQGMAGIAKQYAGEQSKSYRALFAISKAFSVAQAAMSISTGLAKAQELGFPANLAEMARVAATGAGIISQINGSQFSGAYDQGGQIPAGKIGIVGEYGPELVRGPATVTGRELTARKARDGGDSATPAAAPNVNIRNINVLDPSVVGDYLATDAGEQLIMNVVKRNQSAFGG